ncbi:MAG: VWA domain-containing protein [Acidobacteriota bacterium]
MESTAAPIRVRTDLVELFVTVRRGSRPVIGLTPDDFVVTDQGRVQKLVYFKTEKSSLRVVMLLDTSLSIAEDLPFLQAAGLRFLSALKPGDEVGLFSFGGSIRELAPISGNLTSLGQVLRSVHAEGNTHLFDAIARGVTELREPGIRRGIVLFTDGDDTASRLSKANVARLCGRGAIPLFVIGTGDAVRNHKFRKLLEELAGATGADAFFPKDSKGLSRAFEAVSDRLRTGYGAGFYSESPPDGRWHDIQVKLRGKKGEVTVREGYYAD